MEVVKDKPETTPPIVGEYDVPTYMHKITPEEFKLLTKPLKMFEWALALRNTIINRAKIEGGVVPVFETDVMQDEKGQMVLKQAFIEKYTPKKEETVVTN